MEEAVSAATVEVDPVKMQLAEREIYDWVFENFFAASLYTHDGIWPIEEPASIPTSVLQTLQRSVPQLDSSSLSTGKSPVNPS